MERYPHIFTPLTVKGMTLNNRIVMMPMGTNYGKQNGEMSLQHIHYYELRAKGGTGLLIVENASVDSPSGSNGTTQLRIDQDSYIPRLFSLCETVHRHGSQIAIQINHAGASAMSSRTGSQPVSASNIPTKDGGDIPRPLTGEEIEQIATKYGQAAQRAQIAGFDAVEIHAGHSYLISQFLSPITNKRTDEYGGNPENRARFAAMVMRETRAAVGPHFPIILRISTDELVEGGNSVEDTLELLEYIQPEADIIDASAGLNPSIYYQIDANYLPDGWRSFMAKAVRDRFGKPTIAMGNIRHPKVAERILAQGDSDLIGIGRGLIADPEWVRKAEMGQEHLLRKCISCNIGCAGHRIGLNRPIRCTVNPTVDAGTGYRENKVIKPCNVVVIGGGTTGLEAACTAAEVGCTTFLFEKEPVLGGLAAEISKIPDKKRLYDFPRYLINRAAELKNLIIFKSTVATVELIESCHPDIIINATGSSPLLPSIIGLHECMAKEGSRVVSIQGMIENLANYPEEMTGKKVVVIGGGAVGLDVAEFFAPRNAQVTVVEMMAEIGKDLDPVSKTYSMHVIKEKGITLLTETTLLEVRDDHFVVRSSHGDARELHFDYGFVCLGMRASAPVLNALKTRYRANEAEVCNIGDSLRARRIIDGVLEGHYSTLNSLEKRGFLLSPVTF